MSGKTLWERHLSRDLLCPSKQAMKLLKGEEEERTSLIDEIASAQALMQKKKKKRCGILEE